MDDNIRNLIGWAIGIIGGLLIVLASLVSYIFVSSKKSTEKKISELEILFDEKIEILKESFESLIKSLTDRHNELGNRFGLKLDGNCEKIHRVEQECARVEIRLLEYQASATSTFVLKDDCQTMRQSCRDIKLISRGHEDTSG